MIKAEARNYLRRTLFIIIAMLVIIMLPAILPKEQRLVLKIIRGLFFSIAIILYGIYFYRNRKDWVELLIQALSIALLAFAIMRISKPMMEEPYNYKPEQSNLNSKP